MSNRRAELLMRERLILSSRAFVEIVIWNLPRPMRGSLHQYKYRLAYVVDGTCVLRFDNESGKGDHRHVHEMEFPYVFADLTALQRDFWSEVNSRRKGN